MELTQSESNEDLGFPSNQERSPFNPTPSQPSAIKKLTRLKVNLSTPLIVKTQGGENMAGPGDVVGHIGKHDVMISKDLFIALLGKEKYDELVRKEMLKIRIAKRFDDGLAPFSREELSTQRNEIDQLLSEIANRAPDQFDPNDINQRIQIVDSSEGPPTARPDEFATIVPGPMLPIPEDGEDGEEELPGNGGEGGLDAATGATAGSPGSFTPSGGTAPVDFNSLSTLTADPSTAWTQGQYIVLGDGSEAYWNGTAWTVGRAPGGVAVTQPQTSTNPFQH